ncbi:uncharacterized protein LOC109598506 [Aethina tumida]|uniref:uncharacterized protein LOC109598506 n=1 Tax=Aethina tumida TaxID=116153 RepID=UPI00096B5BDE|nr:uncharacterized protein LOC109598506 [Aethina tumida]
MDNIRGAIVAFLVITAVCIDYTYSLSPSGCPLSSKVTTCSPKCKDDSDCFGKKCCPDICNQKSCVAPEGNSNTRDGYKNQHAKTATGSYCGNVKCNSFEKCQLEPGTKRQKCIRF